MNKVMKISKTLNTIAGVIRTILKVAAIIIAVAVAILMFVSSEHEMWRNGTYTLGLGQVTLELVPDVSISTETTRLLMIGGLIFCIPLLLFSAKYLHIIQDILIPMSQGKPFDRSVSSSLRKLSFITLIIGVISEIGNAVAVLVPISCFDPSILFNPEYVSGYTLGTVLNLNFLLPCAILYLMSHVFRYGEELQQLSDETL